MTIEKKLNNKELVISVCGRLDTMTSPQLESELNNLEGVESIVLDFAKLEYISSAGLRTVLMAQKKMSSQKGLVVKNVNSTVREVFDITGFSEILTIK